MQQPSYFLQCMCPFSTFIECIYIFYSSLLQMFGCVLGPRSFDNPKGPLTCIQASLPIIFGGIELTLTSTIALTTYLRSWAFITSIIIIRFMVDQHPFLLEALAQVDNNTFPIQQDFKATCDFLSPHVRTCLPSFK